MREPRQRGGRGGRGGLSLSAFAGAKISTFDKRGVEERHYHAAAKQRAALRKLRSKLGEQPVPAYLRDEAPPADGAAGAGAAGGAAEEAEEGRDEGEEGAREGGERRRRRAEPRAARPPKRGFNALEALAIKRAGERREAEAARATRVEEAAARSAAREAAAAARKAKAAGMRKRNARGQPLMRYRVESILETLQKEQQRTL